MPKIPEIKKVINSRIFHIFLWFTMLIIPFFDKIWVATYRIIKNKEIGKRWYVLSDFILIPVPLDKKRLKWRGFNQAEEVGKELYKFFNIPLISDCLIKIKQNLPQIELSGKQREENTKGVFSVKTKELINGKKIVLVDDIYTTGSTMEECAKVLKTVGAKEVLGIVVARG